MTSLSGSRKVFITAVAALVFAGSAALSALACPEITLDPKTGVAIAQPDLEAALAALSASQLVTMADASR